MDRPELLSAIVRLGNEFKRLRLERQLRALRVYYLAVKSGLPARGNDVDLKWDERFWVEWMENLRVPPFDRAVPVHPQGWTCTRCGKQTVEAGARTIATFPGGVRYKCAGCGKQWLVLEAS